ncbi:hypothetical protein CDAR_241471 [Caerostris darwini]|uniref:Uncharacterized protein n=1 Tax=Caerostris darwini TaxID=1538125 RepID=A0AAV4R6Z5_9ARAC|nr:hypothetical protein CDAR_241471 [Caerostris darwini]
MEKVSQRGEGWDGDEEEQEEKSETFLSGLENQATGHPAESNSSILTNEPRASTIFALCPDSPPAPSPWKTVEVATISLMVFENFILLKSGN